MAKQTEVVDVQVVGGARNLTFSIKVTRPDGSGLSFTLTPAGANALADRLNAALDDPNEPEARTKLERWSDRRAKRGL